MSTLNNAYTCFRVIKCFRSNNLNHIESRTTKSFKKEIDNSNNEKYYYFNFNHLSGKWEHSYCQCMTEDIRKAFIKCKNMFLMYSIYIEREQLSLCLELENKLKNTLNKKEELRKQYEQSKNKLRDKYSKQIKEVC